MAPEKRERLARLLSAAELGFKDAASALREADALLRQEAQPVAGVDRGNLQSFAAVAEANGAGIENMEARLRQAGERRP